jgi:hypothetical protein
MGMGIITVKQQNQMLNRDQVCIVTVPAGLLFWIVTVFVCVCLLGSGCSSKTIWYKSGAGQLDFNIDDMECSIMAKEIARQATLTGKMIDLEVFKKTYESCIYARGWSQTPVDTDISAKNSIKKTRLAHIEDNVVTVFDHTMTIPKTFSLLNDQPANFQGVNMHTLFFQGENGVYLNMIFQETKQRKFEPLDYPSAPPFFLFEKGSGVNGDEKLRWTLFAGEFQKIWIAGIGAYYLVDDYKRISFVLTRPISSPAEKPPGGLRLTKVQKLEVEAFKDRWIEAVKQRFH